MPEIVDPFLNLPVVAPGGIADGRGLAAALMLEAEGVLMGTRFYASQEAKGHPEAKQRAIQAGGDDPQRSIVFHISRRNIWPQPYTGRAIRNTPSAGLRLDMDHPVHRLLSFAIRVLRSSRVYLFWPVFCSLGWPVVCGVAPVV